MSADAENQPIEPADDPTVTTTTATAGDHETAAATTLGTATTATNDATAATTPQDTTSTTAPPDTTTTTPPDTTAPTVPPDTTTTTAPPETAATPTVPPDTTTTTPPETATTTTVPLEAATTATGATSGDEEQPDTAGPDQTTDSSETTGPSDDTTGEAVSAPGGDPSGAEAPAAEEPPSEVTPYRQALAAAGRLAPDFVLPNDCQPPPLNSPYSMPNAPRIYRSGVHAGVDFLCSTAGHPVVAALSGQVVVAAGSYTDPTVSEWNELLDAAIALGDTPAYTNAMLSGSYVVVDHGIISDVGHVVSLYAHLDGVDPAIRVGKHVHAGQRLGGIGNTGTRAGASGNRYGQLHLHWNFYVDDQYLGAGLSTAETREVYAELFKHGTGTEPASPGIESGAGTPRQGGGTLTPGPGPAEPGTITPSGRKPLADPTSFEEARAAAERLSADIVVPSDCQPVPLVRASALPNAPRPYRSGTHQGIDFGCSTLGHPVTAALAGRVVVAVGDFEDPTPLERNQLLDTAAAIGATPPYTLVMLYGNHVVVDHGIIDGVGHVVSLYARLDALEPGIRAGLSVEAGQPLGRIGNSGTSAGASGAIHNQLHLHWELHIDGQYLGIGLPYADTRAVYAALFSNVSG